jgi:Holliday junction resolvase
LTSPRTCDIIATEQRKGATKMTFKVYVKDCEPFYIDVETLDDLASFASEYSLADKLLVNFQTMSITIE